MLKPMDSLPLFTDIQNFGGLAKDTIQKVVDFNKIVGMWYVCKRGTLNFKRNFVTIETHIISIEIWYSQFKMLSVSIL